VAKTILFVYGTLKRGQRNHHLIASEEFRREAVTEPHYGVIDLGLYPGLVVNEAGGLAVRGELWAVSDTCLELLDDFECVQGLFIREEVAVVNQTEVTYAYYWHGESPADSPRGDSWPMSLNPRR
jgi:gamma-glutamylaminecyclotransferase